MYVINFLPTKTTYKWCEKHHLDLKRLAIVVSIILNKQIKKKKVSFKNIRVQIRPNFEGSYYVQGSDKLQIAGKHEYCYNKTQKRRLVTEHILHEFRHWMQDRILNNFNQGEQYTEIDVKNNTLRYYRNHQEIDARRFAAKNIRKVIRYYNAFQ